MSLRLPSRMREWDVRRVVREFPFILLILVPGWFTAILIDRDDEDTGNLLYYYIPDLTANPHLIPINLTITPLVNTEGDQIILVSVLVATFGVMVERRLGLLAALGIFWGTSAVAALGGGIVLHLIHPFLSHIDAIDEAFQRVFNGGSAGAFGLMGAFAVTSRWPWFWIGLFLLWEPGFWATVSQDFTSTFHIVSFTTGFVTVRFFLYDRLKRRNAEREAERLAKARLRLSELHQRRGE